MEHKPDLLYGQYYHIYNRGINKAAICFEDDDCEHFIDLLKIYTKETSSILSYAVMMNHFHLALRIKNEAEIGYLVPANANSEDASAKWQTFVPESSEDRSGLIKPRPDKMIAHALNAYVKWFNHKYKRSGRLFERRFERKLIESQISLKNRILYINANPDHHKVIDRYGGYPWTSYNEIICEEDTWIDRSEVIRLFGDVKTFQ